MKEKALFSQTTRRGFLRSTAAAGLTGILAGGAPFVKKAAAQSRLDLLPNRPNLLFVITDQQRFPRHWPAGWAEENLEFTNRLSANGLTFTRAYCNSAMCSPSRVTLFTGLYPAHHQVVDTLTSDPDFPENSMPLDMQNMARVLASAGYQVEYRGKWHLSEGPNQEEPTQEDVKAYGFNGWVPPDAGHNTNPATFGGGRSAHDHRFVDEAIEFINTYDGDKPFALFVSLVNPHDVLCYPKTYQDDYPELADGLDLGITLPPTINENLSCKPRVHAAQKLLQIVPLGRLNTTQQELTYVNFYAQLHIQIEQELMRLYNALSQETLNNTVIIRTSDHGELGLSHGGLRQKAYNVYEETVNVPLIISNPILFQNPEVSNSLVSLIDLMPTVASIAGVSEPDAWTFRGYDLTPILNDSTAKVQDTILFTYDDQRAGSVQGPDPAPQPNHIQAIITEDWKYARYYDPSGAESDDFEMYDLSGDTLEVNNLACPSQAQYSQYEAKRSEMQQKLNEVMSERLAPIEQTAVNAWQHL